MGNCCMSRNANFEFTADDGDAIQPTPSHPNLKQERSTPQQSVTTQPAPVSIETVKEEKKPDQQPELSAEQYYKLAKSMEKGTNKAESEESFANFLKAAELGHAKAQLRVAYCYDVGTGVKQDAVLAAKWYLAAADTEPKAQFSLGLCYAKGLGVPKDDKEAVKWFQRASDSGYERALYNLGYCYEMGTGVDRNTDRALEFYQQAASKGSELAKKRLQLYGINQ